MNELTEAEKAEFSKAMEEMEKTFEKIDKRLGKLIKIFEPDPIEDYEDGIEAI